jgi:hypothetical protein
MNHGLGDETIDPARVLCLFEIAGGNQNKVSSSK